MSQSQDTQLPHRSLGWRVFQFLGTMEFAITMLITLAIASVIGTVLQQNQPYPDYVIKFGPFWFEVFETLGLYDVYSALWFLGILALLLISTTVCLIRNTPLMLKDMTNLRTNVQYTSLRSMAHHAHWHQPGELAANTVMIRDRLALQGFRTRINEKGNDRLVSAMRGGMNRLGYILTHLAIIIICFGGLMDSNLPLKIAEWQGRLKIETRDLPLSDIPKQSRLAVGPQAFRGSVSIPEGRAASVAYLPMRDGYLVQNLPFTIEVKDFRIEHYPTGQPKSFESDLVLHDPELEEPLQQTIAVNHPMIHKGYAIYQASFGDGGSGLSIDVWPLFGRQAEPTELEVKVFETRQMIWGDSELQLEVTGFRPFNINPDPTENDPKNVRNFGPSIQFKLRRETGEALEFENYMYPIKRDGRDFFLSGVRGSPSEEFAFLYLPADEDGSIDGFIHYLHALHDDATVATVAAKMRDETLLSLQSQEDHVLGESLKQTLETLIEMFVKGGFDEVRNFIEHSLPEAERDTLAPAYLAMLREMLGRIYLNRSGLEGDERIDEVKLLFLQDAIEAVGTLPRYGAPVYLSLTDFDHVQSTGLQIARSPGKNIVYLGCIFLVSGIFLLFYLPQRRFWAWLSQEGDQIRIDLAGMTNRNPREFDNDFAQIYEHLQSPQRNSVTD